MEVEAGSRAVEVNGAEDVEHLDLDIGVTARTGEAQGAIAQGFH